jgi:carbon-monoxide dehydrogenase small subunit
MISCEKKQFGGIYMSEDKKKAKEVTRRQFLAGTGVVVGGAAIGSVALLSACGGETTKTITDTVTSTTTSTVPGGTATVTTTAPGTTETVTTTTTVTEGGPAGIPGVVTLTINGHDYIVKVDSNWTLAFVLRDKLGMQGTKVGCDSGGCGTCGVIADGKSVFSCMMLACECQGKDIWTVEGLSDGVTLSPLQQAFYDNSAFQCGYCTPGVLMASKALLDVNPNPTKDEVKEALSGHLCGCGNFKAVIDTLAGGI